MLKAKTFICGDFGAGTLKLAEFEPNESGSLRLLRFATRSLGLEGSKESTRAEILINAMKDALDQGGFESNVINLCAPGFSVFSKFVKIPNVETAKASQIIKYEAQQNVPFPLEEVVWDYQVLGESTDGGLEFLLVAIKTDVVEGLMNTAENVGLRLNLVDVSPAALCNAYRFSYIGEEGCTLLLDIGAKTSNLLFFEGDRVFSRSINIGANAITQDFCSESGMTFDEAEAFKIEQGFVSLGGAYEEPDDPNLAQISKIARQVMTRLHIQMNQTIQFYRGQQGGSAPQRLYLAGGASALAYTAEFFSEKLNIPVEYFNPFANVEFGDELDLEQFSYFAHTFGEAVGLGIRNLAQCPVNLNLMPTSYVRREMFRQKKPYFLAAILSLILVVFAWGGFYHRVASIREAEVAKIEKDVTPLTSKLGTLNAKVSERDAAAAKASNYLSYVDQRLFWGRFLESLRASMVAVEKSFTVGESTRPEENDHAGIWIESMKPLIPAAVAPAQGGMGRSRGPGQGASAAPAGPVTVHYVDLTCRAKNLLHRAPAANNEFAFAFHQALTTNVFLDPNPEGTKLLDMATAIEEQETFTFNVRLLLKTPITLY